MLVKSHRGLGFCFHFSAEANPKQKPTQSFFFSGCTLERDFEIKDEKVSKRPKIKQSIALMFSRTVPKLVESFTG